jgi:hypothetical protein
MKIDNRQRWTALIVDDNCEYKKFRAVADILRTGFNLPFTHKLDDLDTSYWDFEFNGCSLTLHYNVQAGLFILPTAFKQASDADNNCVIEIGKMLTEYVGENRKI